MITIQGHNAPEAYADSLWKMRTSAKMNNTRNGYAYSIETPVMLEIQDPRERLITDSIRDANPFFHCMEFIWMMSGSNDARWLCQFNKRYSEYLDDGIHQHAAYGHRWRSAFGRDQVLAVANVLSDNSEDRRAVLQMWSTELDLCKSGRDFPCNTQIIPRIVDGRLDFLVTNRSNDLIWGMLGANVVHMTMLQELMANMIGCDLGCYRVISTNVHMYRDMPRFEEIWKSLPTEDIYTSEFYESSLPLISGDETYEMFVHDCQRLISNKMAAPMTRWMRHVGDPIHTAWFERGETEQIKAWDWRNACQKWLSRGSRGSFQPSGSIVFGESETKTPEDGQ